MADLRVKIFHCFLAFTLVIGLMVPTFSTAAYGEGADDAGTSPAASQQEPQDAGADDSQPATKGTTPADADADAGDAPQAGDTGAESGDDPVQDPGEGAGNVEGNEPTGDSNATEGEGNGGSEGTGEPVNPEDQPVTSLDGSTTWNGLTIKGGVNGTDFTVGTGAGNIVTINTSTPLELSGTFTGSIQVKENIEAWVTFNGLTVTASTERYSPFNLLNPTTCHITLADGSINTLNANGFGHAALHCGDGSTLYIDDSILNYLQDGTHVEVLNGVVNTDGTLKNGTVVKKGDLVNKISASFELDGSGSVGKLVANGGNSSSGIGAGPCENAGNMIFDGGWIVAKSWIYNGNGNTDNPGSSGTGIGAGSAGGATNMTFNAATVDAYGSYHGAGIGAGWTTNGAKTTRQIGAATTAVNKTCGNIYINGGYLKAQGYAHGNAFGGACGTTASGKTIKITGGTLLPTSQSGKCDIGGSGGKVIIDGGSVKLTGATAGKPAPSGKFQSSDNKAYNSAGQQMFLLCIDLKTSDKIGTEPVANWELRIGGAVYDYGTPSYFDDGQLYLWLPNDAKGKEITIKVAKYGEDGSIEEVEDLTSTPSGNGDLGKRWISYSIDGFLAENKQLTDKYYDGSSIETVITALEDYTTKTGIPAPYGANKDAMLKDGTQLEYQAARTAPDGTTLLPGEEYLPSTASHDHGELPTNSGTISVLISSKEFASVGTTSQSFWGHRTNMVVNVHPVTSLTSCLVPESNPVIIDGEKYTTPVWVQDQNGSMGFATSTNNHLVVPVDVVSHKLPFGDQENGSDMSNVACAAPTGKLQLYIDGVKVPSTYGGVFTLSEENFADGKAETGQVYKDASGRAHAQAYFDLDRRQINAFFTSSDYRRNNNFGTVVDENGENPKHQIYVEYNSVTIPDPLLRDEVKTPEEAAASLSTLANEEWSSVDESAGVEYAPKYADYAYVNYYESKTAVTPVEIKTVDPTAALYNDFGTAYDPTAESGAAATPVTDEAHIGHVINKVENPVTGKWDDQVIQNDSEWTIDQFRDVLNEDTGAVVTPRNDWFPLYFTTNSIGDVTFTSSNPAVISFDPATIKGEYVEGKDEYGYGTKAHVNSAGVTTITAHVAAAGSYNSATRSFQVRVYPDLDKKPVLKIDETSYDSTRKDGTIRPGDELVYVSKTTNSSEDTALFNPVFTMTVPADVTLKSLTAIDSEGNEIELTEGKDFTVKDGKIVYEPDTVLYGGADYTLVMKAQVKDDVALKSAKGEEVALQSEATAAGVYGINADAFQWDDRVNYAKGEPVAKVKDTASPTREKKDDQPGKDAEKVIGADLIEQDPTPDPDDKNPIPGILVGPVDKPSPAHEAEKPGKPADPETGTPEGDPTPFPIRPGDVITKFGDDPDPRTPGDVAKEVDEQVKKKLEEDPDATEVKIPVTITRPDPKDPTNPDKNIVEEVLVTIPIQDGKPVPPTDPDEPTPGPGGDEPTPGPDDPDNPDNPDDPTDPDDPKDPDKPYDPDRDDHGLVILPTDPVIPDPGPTPGPDDPTNPDDPTPGPGDDDPTPGPGGDQPGGDVPDDLVSDIKVTKTMENVTPGFDKRKNKYALVDDVIEYTITVENTKPGSAWLDAKVYDRLPAGVQYIPGSTVIKNNAFGTAMAPSAAQDNELYGGDATTARLLGFALGDVHGGTTATVTFRVKLTPDAVIDGAEVPDNVASASGIKPSETIVYPEGTDPDEFDPSGDTPIEIADPDPDPEPFDPTGGDPEAEDVIPQGPGSEPGTAKPDGTSHTDPDHAKFSTDKTATVIAAADDPEGEELEDREEGVLYVGDTVRYEITFKSDDQPWTAWYDVTVYDKLPEGMTPVPGTFRLTAPGQTESVAIDDSVYNAEDHDVAVWIGRVLGGETAVLSFDCIVSEAALDSDVGNTATVAGTDPSATDPSVLDGDPEAVPGIGKRTPKPAKGWESFFEERGASFSQTAYPDDNPSIEVRPDPSTNEPAPKPLPDDGNEGNDPNGPGNGVDGNDGNGGLAAGNGQSGLGDGGQGLAKTGDAAPIAALIVLALAAAGALGFGLVRKRRRS